MDGAVEDPAAAARLASVETADSASPGRARPTSVAVVEADPEDLYPYQEAEDEA